MYRSVGSERSTVGDGGAELRRREGLLRGGMC